MKISIIGSSGKVAKQLAQNAFTRNTSDLLKLVFVSNHPNLVASYILDLQSAEPLLLNPNYIEPAFSITSNFADVAGSDIVFICSGKFMDAAKKEAFRKIDPSGRLAHSFVNVGLIKDIAHQIQTHSPQSLVVVVTNQSDVLADVARTILKADHVYGMGGLLDEARFKKILADHLNVFLPKQNRIRSCDLDVEITGYHNDSMILVADSLVVPGHARELLKQNPTLIEDALQATKAYGRNISQINDSRHPTVHTGASVGPGAACWLTIAALTAQVPAIKASFNAVATELQGRRYGIASGDHLSMQLAVGRGGFREIERPASCSDGEVRAIRNAVTAMRATRQNLDSLEN